MSIDTQKINLRAKQSLYLLPQPLGEGAFYTIPVYAIDIIVRLECFFVESERAARRFIARCLKAQDLPTTQINQLEMLNIAAPATPQEIHTALNNGKNWGVVSDAGCPGIADPGAQVVSVAQQLGITVVPVVGPSAILLALMASGLNGQQFYFHGYLPIKADDRRKQLYIINDNALKGSTQLFIETPYRNQSLLDAILQHCNPQLALCIAVDISLPTQYIVTRSIQSWKKSQLPGLHKRPTIFLVGQAHTLG